MKSTLGPAMSIKHKAVIETVVPKSNFNTIPVKRVYHNLSTTPNEYLLPKNQFSFDNLQFQKNATMYSDNSD